MSRVFVSAQGNLLAALYFVAAKVLLGFNVENVLAKHWVVLAQRKLLRSVLSVLNRVVVAVSAFF